MIQFARVQTQNGIVYAKHENGKYYRIIGDIFNSYSITNAELYPVKLLAPVTPSKIIAIGANYKNHAKELNLEVTQEPIIFLKPPTSLLEPNGYIIYPKQAKRVDYEAELAIVIGKQCHNVSEQRADQYILGYTVCNDVTEREMQKRDGQWIRAKGFDTFCPIGAYVTSDIDPTNLQLKTLLNGIEVQSGNTSDLIHSVQKIVAFTSSIMTLFAGDIILTGTPEGVGEIQIGDTVEVFIEKLGSTKNIVVGSP